MEVEKITGIGAPDLAPEPFAAALEAVLAREGYVLEWKPGAKTWKETGCGLHIFWRSFPGRGTWANLPPEPHDRKLAIALVQTLNRPLVFHEARWLIDGDQGELRVESWDMQLDGSLQPRPTGLEFKSLEAITSGKGDDRLNQLLRHLMGIMGCGTPSHGTQFALFEFDPAAKPSENPPQGSVVSKHLGRILDLLRQPGIRGKLLREDSDRYELKIWKKPTTFGFTINSATVEALKGTLQAEGLPELQGPTIWLAPQTSGG